MLCAYLVHLRRRLDSLALDILVHQNAQVRCVRCRMPLVDFVLYCLQPITHIVVLQDVQEFVVVELSLFQVYLVLPGGEDLVMQLGSDWVICKLLGGGSLGQILILLSEYRRRIRGHAGLSATDEIRLVLEHLLYDVLWASTRGVHA